MTGVEPEIAAQDTLSCALTSVHDLPPAPMTSTGFAGALARAHGYAAYTRTSGSATAQWRHRWASRDTCSGPRRCRDGGGSSEPLAHVGEGVEVFVGGPARSHYDLVVYRSTRRRWPPPGHRGGPARRSTSRRPRRWFCRSGSAGWWSRTVKPDGVSWSCCNCATIFTRTR